MLDFKALQDMELLVDDDLDKEFLEVFAKKLSNTPKSNSLSKSLMSAMLNSKSLWEI